MREAKKSYTIAVDLGQSSIIVAAGYKDRDGALQIASLSQHYADGVRAGRVENIAQVNAAMSKGIAEIESALNVEVQQAYGGISGELVWAQQHSESVNVSEPDNGVSVIDISSLHSLMERVRPSERDTLLELSPQNYIIDSTAEIKSPAGNFGRVLSSTYNFVLCEKESLNRISRAYSQAGITLKRCFANSVVAAEAVLTYDEMDAGVAVVDLGAGMTNVSIYYRGTLRYIGSIPIGGSAVNNDIKSLMVQERSIEELKCSHGVAIASMAEGSIDVVGRTPRDSRSLSLHSLGVVIEARMMDIIEFVNREIYDAGFADKLTYGVVLTGGGAKLKHIDKLFERELNLAVRIANPEEGLGEESQREVASPEYATIVGLLRRGVEADDKGVGKSCTVEIEGTPTEHEGITPGMTGSVTPYQAKLSEKEAEMHGGAAEGVDDNIDDGEEGDEEEGRSLVPPMLKSVGNFFKNRGLK